MHIDFGFGPLASRDLTIEQDVNLAVGSILHLRQEEVCHDEANRTCGTPDVATLATKGATL